MQISNINILIINVSLLLGIFLFYLVIRLKILNRNLIYNENKKLKKKIPFKVDKFINNFGTINNIVKTEYSLTKIKIFVKEIKLVKIENLKRMKHRGIIKQSNSISIVLGNYVKDLSQLLENCISQKDSKI